MINLPTYSRETFDGFLSQAKKYGYIPVSNNLITFGERMPLDTKIVEAMKDYTVTIVEGNDLNVYAIRQDYPEMRMFFSLAQAYEFDQVYDIGWWFHGPEHVTKEEAHKIIRRMVRCCRYVILSMPHGRFDQGATETNPLEEHKTEWYIEDFAQYKNCHIFTQTTQHSDTSSLDVFIKGDCNG